MYRELKESIADHCEYPKFGDIASVNGKLYAVIDLVLREMRFPVHTEHVLVVFDIEKMYSGTAEIQKRKFAYKIYTKSLNTYNENVTKHGVATGELLKFMQKKRLEYDMIEAIEK